MDRLRAQVAAVEAVLLDAERDEAAHCRQESDPPDYRTINGTWRDLSDMLADFRAALASEVHDHDAE